MSANSRPGPRWRRETEAELGGIDILVNNAAVFPRVNFLDMTEADWDHVLDINLKGTFFCAQAAARRDGRGRTRRHDRQPDLGRRLSRLAARLALLRQQGRRHRGLTRQMALELAPHRIRVNAIAPGLTDTAQPRYGSSDEELYAAGRLLPLGRLAQPEDIARGAVFLASEDAGFVTGQILHINGGGYLA